jgi:hypothetical protein
MELARDTEKLGLGIDLCRRHDQRRAIRRQCRADHDSLDSYWLGHRLALACSGMACDVAQPTRAGQELNRILSPWHRYPASFLALEPY